MACGGIWHILTRKKILDPASIKSTKLSRCLNTGDLTALGVGSTLGVGIYVLAGHVAKESAGPSVVVSFFLAAIASVFAGLCYAEFGARVPRAGSAYIYSYICIGEFIAFVVGWNLILEYIIGSASVSKGVSLYLDTLMNNTLKTAFRDIAPINVSNMSPYFDILAFCLVLVVGCGLAFGLKQSSIINNIFTIINMGIVIFVIATGALKANIDNWFIPESEIAPEYNGGKGGFFPFGFSGTLTGAATCFFGFIGFDCIATTGEEVQNPKKSIPLAILLSLLIIFLSYFGVSAIITLMLPYYLQDSDAPIPHVFEQLGWIWAKWVVSIGGMFGLLASLFGALLPLPRILYAMALDGLIFRFLGTINLTYRTPVIGTIIAALITGLMAGCFELNQLVKLMSIGTLMAYTVVAACIIVLRYKCVDDVCPDSSKERNSDKRDNDHIVSAFIKNDMFENDIEIDEVIVGSSENLSTFSSTRKNSYGDVFKQIFNINKEKDPTQLSAGLVITFIIFYCLLSIGSGLFIKYMWDDITSKTIWSILILCIFFCCKLFIILSVSLQPRTKDILSFQVPCVPLIPFISILFNIYLMLMLDVNTWIRFGVWMAIGLIIYLISLCAYGRGPNYVTNVQKSSVNGHIKGNLNYAFENMTECQENESVDMKIEPLVVMNFENDYQDHQTSNNSNEVMDSNIEKDLSIKEDNEIIHNIVTENDKIDEKSPDAYGQEIIQMLDQVLQDADDTIDENDDAYRNISNVAVGDSSLNDDGTQSFDSSIHYPLIKNVIALVHNEDKDDNMEVVNESKTIINLESVDSSVKTVENIIVDENPSIITVKLTKKESIPKSKSTIPAPPPMNEEFFNSTPKTYIKFKAPIFDPSKKNERIHIKMARKSSLDETNSEMLSKSELIAKLNNLYENQAKSSELKRGISFDPKKNPSDVYGHTGMHRSEPDLNYILKKEGLNTNLSTVSIPLNDDDSKRDNLNEKSERDETTETIEDEQMNKEDIKKKLEQLFSKTPKMARSKIPTNNNPEDNNEIEIKPKAISFTNTMKLQRERFENVLKSFEEARLSNDVNNLSMEHISLPRARLSVQKKNESDTVKI